MLPNWVSDSNCLLIQLSIDEFLLEFEQLWFVANFLPQDQVWLEPDFNEQVIRYPELSKKGKKYNRRNKVDHF